MKRGPDVLVLLGTSRAAALSRVAPPPVDLSRPIADEAAWRRIRRHASDAAYRRAVETVRLRYRMVADAMLLPRTIQDVMARAGLTFREAVIRVARDDGLGPGR